MPMERGNMGMEATLRLVLARVERMEAAMQRMVARVDVLAPAVASAVVTAMDGDGNGNANALSAAPVVLTNAQLEATVASAFQRARGGQSDLLDAYANLHERAAYTSASMALSSLPLVEAHVVDVDASPHAQPRKMQPRKRAQKVSTQFAGSIRQQRVHKAADVAQCTPRVPQSAGAAPAVVSPGPSGQQHRLYLWGDGWHALPEEYDIPRESVEIMWRQWCCGDSAKGFPPLRTVESSDLASANSRKRLSDLRFLMRRMEQSLQDRGVWKASPTEAEADQMLRAVKDAIHLGESAVKGHKRSLEELKWHSAVTLLRNSASKKAKKLEA